MTKFGGVSNVRLFHFNFHLTDSQNLERRHLNRLKQTNPVQFGVLIHIHIVLGIDYLAHYLIVCNLTKNLKSDMILFHLSPSFTLPPLTLWFHELCVC